VFRPLRSEGVDLAIFAITAQGWGWADRAGGYDIATFYVTPDSTGEAYQLFSADAYDVYLIDKKGRIATSWSNYYDATLTDAIKLKIRQLNDE
jgi:hypothetical protein